ncbi:hypothetical protein BT69DRAFT_1247414 [Atractiella rhizophila]|nr:hypothetical protein BT69DRAFT_1247414 [Atractiella rhizophila]
MIITSPSLSLPSPTPYYPPHPTPSSSWNSPGPSITSPSVPITILPTPTPIAVYSDFDESVDPYIQYPELLDQEFWELDDLGISEEERERRERKKRWLAAVGLEKKHPYLVDFVQDVEPEQLVKRWSGWDTTTVFVTVTEQPDNTGTVTVTTTIGEPAPPGTGTITVTRTLNPGGGSGPSTVTVTVYYPGICSDYLENGGTCYTTTTLRLAQSTTTLYVPGGGGGSQPDNQPHVHRSCQPGDAGEKDGSGLRPTKTQQASLYAIALYLVAILVGWNLFAIRHLLYPLKLVVVAYHEFGHVVFAALSGARVESVSIDPNEGGSTQLEGGIWPIAALIAGYPSSILIGGALTFCGFNTLASKIASGIILLTFLVVFWWANGAITKVLTAAAAGLLIGLWFIDHAVALRYFVLFTGVMSSFYVVWDVMDDFVFRKVNPCCVVQFATRIPRLNPGIWGAIWLIVSIIFFVSWVLIALVTWRQTPHGMYCQSQSFLPT